VSDFTRLSRRDWLGLADRFYRHLEDVLDRLSPADWERPTQYLGWSARDVLAHMTSAMPVNFRQVLDRALAGNPGAPPEFDTFTRNAREVARRRRTPMPELRREFRSELEALLATYRGITDSDWERPAWFFVGRVSVRTLFLVQLADNVLHERDLSVASGRWDHLDPQYAAPLVDWFIRELRPATFRPERARGLQVTVWYRLSSAAGGEWTLTVANDACRVERGHGGSPDVTVEADAEDLVTAAQGRAPSWVGRFARAVDGFRGRARAEDVAAKITGIASLAWTLARRRIRILGNRALASRLNHAFWHFWERTRMTEVNIAKG